MAYPDAPKANPITAAATVDKVVCESDMRFSWRFRVDEISPHLSSRWQGRQNKAKP
jgi:hypothetical protein